MKRLVAIIMVLLLVSLYAAAEAPAKPKLKAFEYTGEDLYTAAICDWLIETNAGIYASGDIAIPCPVILEVDDSNPQDILVWGSFDLYWYELRSTTLFCVSGGVNPGLIHLCEENGNYAVTDFEEVGDGTDYPIDVESIFGMREGLLDKFENIYSESNDTKLEFVVMYAAACDIRINQIQDFGWLPVALPGAGKIADEDQIVIHTSDLGYSLEYDLRRFSFHSFDINSDSFCGVDSLEGISINVQRLDMPVNAVIDTIEQSMDKPVQESTNIGADKVRATLVYDAALSNDVHKNNYIVEISDHCVVITTSNTYYAVADDVVPGADEAIEYVLSTLKFTND